MQRVRQVKDPAFRIASQRSMRGVEPVSRRKNFTKLVASSKPRRLLISEIGNSIGRQTFCFETNSINALIPAMLRVARAELESGRREGTGVRGGRKLRFLSWKRHG